MKKITVLIAVFVFVLLGAGEVFACSCIVSNEQSTRKKIKTAYNQASAVFFGEVTEVNRQEGSVIVRFRVNSLWKGAAASEIIVRTAENSAMCGFNFKIGETYMVYANGADDALQTNLCTRTAASYTDARYLNKLKKPATFSAAVRKN
jgi:hypothetical protein